MMESVSRKEFDDLKKEFNELKGQVTDTEKAFGIIESFKKNWKVLGFLFAVFGGVAGGMYFLGKDVHAIAVAHQIKVDS